MRAGYNERLAWVDLTDSSVEYVELEEELLQRFLGGRGLGAAILYRYARGVEPLSSESLLCLLVGPLTGTGFPLANRLTFVFRSPLTGTIAWANTGGYAGAELKSVGVDGLVIEGRAERPAYIFISDGLISINDASSLWGLGAIESVTRLRHIHGDLRVLSIGPAGERMVRFATVVNDTGRTSGVRHGVGCVMGSKMLKAIAIKGRPLFRPPIAKRDEYASLIKRSLTKLRSSHLLNKESGKLALYGTAIAVEALGKNDALPVKNYRYSVLDGYERLGGVSIHRSILINRLTCSHCPVRCRRETASSGGYRFRVEGPDYAQISSLGTNCLVMDLEAIAYMNYLCYDLGLDPIEMGNILAMYAELSEEGYVRDGLRWGDTPRMLELIQLTAQRRDVGEVLGLGPERAAEELGAPELSMSVKGITIQNADPRAEPAWGLLNSTENFGGAEHIWLYADLIHSMSELGLGVALSKVSDPESVATAVKSRQDLVAVLDSLQVCGFSRYAFSIDDYAEALKLVTGREMYAESLLRIGEEIFNTERLFNTAHGFGESDDTLPDRFLLEPLPLGKNAGNICQLEPMLRAYYRARRWHGGKPVNAGNPL